MSKRATILGTASVIGIALAAGPAAAATLTDFAGTLTTSFQSSDNSGSNSDTVKSWLLGGSAAGPLSDLPNLNFQADASYSHNWASHRSQEVWNFGGSIFWANMDGRAGVNANYQNFSALREWQTTGSALDIRESTPRACGDGTHDEPCLIDSIGGHLTSGGVFGEWYFGNITAMAKGGWLSTGGTQIGGRGNYLGAALAGYFIPDLAITGGVEWGDIVTGRGCQVCGREDVNVTSWELLAEFLFSEEYGVSGYAGFTYSQDKAFGDDTHDNIWMIGLRWYTGGGTLQNHHRNGNLNPWLPGIGAVRPIGFN